MSEWLIQIHERHSPQTGRLYGCKVHVLPKRESCTGGCCGVYRPAYSREEAIEVIREVLQDIRDGVWKRPEKPTPRPENTEFVDETGEFQIGDFFENGTLTAFMTEGET